MAVEQLRPAGNLLVAASGGSLVGRIRRLAGVGADRSSGSTWPLAAVVLLLSVALAVVAVARLSLAEPQQTALPQAEKSASAGPPTEPTGEVDLPESGPPAGHEPPALRLAVGRESDEVVLRLHGQKIDEATLKRLAQAVADGRGGPPVLLAAEKGTPYQEVVKVIDLLSLLGLTKVSLETRGSAVDGKRALPVGIPATFTGAEIVALVGPEVILASDVLPDADRQLQRFLDTGMVRTTPDAVGRLRELHLYRIVERRIDIKLIVAEGRRLLPKEAWRKIETQFGEQFDKEYLPKLRKQYQCDSRRELDAKLRKMGSSLEGLKRQSMEKSFAQYFIEEKVKVDVTSDDVRAYREAHSESNQNAISDEAAIRKKIHDERFPVRRKEYLAGLRKRIPVWTVFGDTDQSKAETEQPDAAPAAPPLPATEADQPASGEKPDAEPPPEPMTDEEAAAHPGAIKLVVLDSFKKPIPRFRVMTGIRANNDGLVSIQFRQFPRVPAMVDQEGGKPANWRVAPVQIGENGVCYWQPVAGQPGDRTDYMLQVEAEGYRPDTFGWISGDATREPLEFRLVREGLFTVQVIESNQQAYRSPGRRSRFRRPSATRSWKTPT